VTVFIDKQSLDGHCLGRGFSAQGGAVMLMAYTLPWSTGGCGPFTSH